MSSHRKSPRLALNRFRSDEKRAGFPSTLKDDPMTHIASYGERPLAWNKDTHDRYACTPTDVSYKVLRGPGPGDTCPLEAKLVDQENPLCCSSRVGPQTHPESMDFFKALKKIFSAVPVQHRLLANYPPNLRRLLQWITSPANNAQIAVSPNPHTLLNTERERFLQLVKFAMMSKSSIDMVAVQNTGPPPSALLTIDPFFVGGNQPYFVIDDRIPLFNDLIRINNEAGGNSQVTVENYTPPASVLSLPPIRSTSVGFGGGSPMYAVDFDDIVAWIDACDNNGWQPRWLNIDHRVVIRPNVSITQHFIALFNSFRRRETRRLAFYTRVPIVPHAAPLPPVNVPAGYEPIDFQPGQFEQLVTAVMDSASGFDFTEIVGDALYAFNFNQPVVGTRRMSMQRTSAGNPNLMVWTSSFPLPEEDSDDY